MVVRSLVVRRRPRTKYTGPINMRDAIVSARERGALEGELYQQCRARREEGFWGRRRGPSVGLLIRGALLSRRCTSAGMKKQIAQLKFCAAELGSISKKKAEMVEMGMEMIVKDLASSESKLESKYMQTELDVLDTLHHHAVLVAKVRRRRKHSARTRSRIRAPPDVARLRAPSFRQSEPSMSVSSMRSMLMARWRYRPWLIRNYQHIWHS